MASFEKSNRRTFLKTGALLGAGVALSTTRVASGSGQPSKVVLAAVPAAASAAAKQAALRYVLDASGATAIGAQQTVTVKVACNSTNPFPATSSPFSASQTALWAAEQTSAMVTVGDHSGTYPIGSEIERGGLHLDSYDAMVRAGIAPTVANIAKQAGQNIRLCAFDHPDGTPTRLIHRNEAYTYPYQIVLVPGAERWSRDLKGHAQKDLAQIVAQATNPNVYADVMADAWKTIKTKETVPEKMGIMELTTAVASDVYFINVARISHHIQAGISYSMKSLVGILNFRSRVRMHFKLPKNKFFVPFGGGLEGAGDLQNVIAEIGLGRAPELNLLDATQIQLNLGPDQGTSFSLGEQLGGSQKYHLFMGSTDMVALDAAALAVHKYAYARFRDGRFLRAELPVTGKHLNPKSVVWDNAMIRAAGEVGLGAKTGADVDLKIRTQYRNFSDFAKLRTYVRAELDRKLTGKNDGFDELDELPGGGCAAEGLRPPIYSVPPKGATALPNGA